MNILGLNTGDHDPSACIVVDGQVVAMVEEERLTRQKHAVGALPVRSAQFCLEASGLSPDDLDCVAVPWVDNARYLRLHPGSNPRVTFQFHPDAPLNDCPRVRLVLRALGVRRLPQVACVSHHLAHASAAFRMSGFDEASILIADGWGDRVSTTLACGRGREISLVDQLSLPRSLGYFYSALTETLGLGPFAEGKTMGLAAYGAASDHLVDEVLKHCTSEEGARLAGLEADYWDPTRSTPEDVFRYWMRSIAGFVDSDRGLINDVAEVPGLKRGSNLAAAGQRALEAAMTTLVIRLVAATGLGQLCLGGGVALNCSANGSIACLEQIEDLFVQPAAGDAGNSLGAALEAAYAFGEPSPGTLVSTSLGPAFTNDLIRTELDLAELAYTETDDPGATAAGLLANGLTVGWMQGRAEFGPRALGHRSILASSARPEMKNVLNDVKRRERWRPLAPAIREEDAAAALRSQRRAPFMIVADRFRSELAPSVPAALHVDGSIRPQTVSHELQADYHRAIEEHSRITSSIAILNTSFNDEKEPMVTSPRESVATFRRTDLDCLVIGNFVCRK